MRVRVKAGWERACAILDVGSSHLVIGIEGAMYRVVDGTGLPILVPSRAFVVEDPTVPVDWITSESDAEPRELMEPRNFFERLHDGDLEIIRRWRMYLQRVYREQAEATASNVYLETSHDGVTRLLELDGEGYEVRRLEIGRGAIRFADMYESEGTDLGNVVVDRASGSAITRDVFESAWDRAHGWSD